MKIILLILSILLSVPGFSQKQFEGNIIYAMHSDESKDSGQVSMFFGKNAIKIVTIPGKSGENEFMLIRFDSAKLYAVNMQEKTFRLIKKLAEKEKPEKDPVGKKIAGFNTTAFDITQNNFGDMFGGSFGVSVILHVADSLYYFISDKYAFTEELMFIADNKIALGMDFFMSNNRMSYEKDANPREKKLMLNFEAILVKWETVPESEFVIPADFTEKTEDNTPVSIEDTLKSDIITQIDSTKQMTQPAKPKQPVKPKPKPKTKTNNNPVGPIKKPE